MYACNFIKLGARKIFYITILNHTRSYTCHFFSAPRNTLLLTNIKKPCIPLEKAGFIKFVHTNLRSSKKCSPKTIQFIADSILKENSDAKARIEVVKILDFLVSHGCTLADIKQTCQNILTPSNSSFVKVLQIAELGQDILKLMPFINISLASLRKAAVQAKEDKVLIPGFQNRILYLSYHLETPIDELIPALAKHSSLLTMQFARLHRKMNFLKDAEIIPEDLVKDLWIFNYNEKLLTNRITAAVKAGVKLKPWMLRCSDKFFTSRIIKDSETQRILEGKDLAQYLASKLDCSDVYVEYMLDKNKYLKTVNVPKIEQIILCLFEKGYTPQEIRIFPRVFSSKIKTLDERFIEYMKVHKRTPTIPQLCLAAKEFRKKMRTHVYNNTE